MINKVPENNETIAVAPQSAPAPQADGKTYKKGLIAPLVPIAASVGGWFVLTGKKLFGSATTVLEDVKTLWSDIFGTGATTVDETVSEFAEGSAASEGSKALLTGQVGLIALVTLIGIIGVIWLFKRLYNNVKHR